jgi:heme O synthase-like polyprenyltransferase
MFLTELFGVFSLSALVVWGFLMAFFFNVFVYSLCVKRNTTLLISSCLMAISYSVGDYFFTWLSPTPATYLDWAIYDVITLFFLVGILVLIKNTTPSFIYLLTGLTINIIFFLLMYFDLYIKGNTTPWILWDMYSFGVNVIDFTMIVVLIVDRDIFCLDKLKDKILPILSKPKVVRDCN